MDACKLGKESSVSLVVESLKYFLVREVFYFSVMANIKAEGKHLSKGY